MLLGVPHDRLQFVGIHLEPIRCLTKRLLAKGEI
jgi:hypothetical protein